MRDREKSGRRLKDISKHASNVEYELKFRYIPKRIYTRMAKSVAKDRLQFMQDFLERVRMEISGDL